MLIHTSKELTQTIDTYTNTAFSLNTNTISALAPREKNKQLNPLPNTIPMCSSHKHCCTLNLVYYLIKCTFLHKNKNLCVLNCMFYCMLKLYIIYMLVLVPSDSLCLTVGQPLSYHRTVLVR